MAEHLRSDNLFKFPDFSLTFPDFQDSGHPEVC